MSMINPKDILYEDESIFVIHKQAKMAVQSARSGQMDLEHLLLNELALRSQNKKTPYLAVIHRLDQPVEGIVVFAKTPKAAKSLSQQIQSGKMEKLYLALTEAKEVPQKGRLENFLKKDAKTNLSKVVPEHTPDAKKAILEFEKIGRTSEGFSLMKIHLYTGRHHQIRVQMANAKMPLLGDTKYNPNAKKEGKIALCAFSLTFFHPESGKKMKFEICPEWADGKSFSE